MLSVVLGPAAQAEVRDAVAWYELRQAGLGRTFLAELDGLMARISENPNQFPAIWRNVRRAMMRHFPYGLYFLIRPDVVQVIACFHSSRNPMRWQERHD